MNYSDVMKELEKLSRAEHLVQLKRFNVTAAKPYGVPIAALRKLSQQVGMDDVLSRQLWFSPVHEAKILGSMIADPVELTEKDVDKLLRSFDSWDVVDEFCLNLFSKSRLGYFICTEYNDAEAEFVKRTAFSMMAILAWHHGNMSDQKFERFLPIIIRESVDERNFVKKAVNWSLRQIGKRNLNLNARAIAAAEKIQKISNESSQWVAKDALRELKSPEIQKRLRSH